MGFFDAFWRGFHGEDETPEPRTQIELWWQTELTSEERALIGERFDPLGASGADTIEALLSGADRRPANTLTGIAGHVNKPDSRRLAQRLAAKAVEVGERTRGVLDEHFAWAYITKTNYPDREDDAAFARAVAGCEGQIAMSKRAKKAFQRDKAFEELPGHAGFQQLAIIRAKQGRYADAIEVCEQARIEGWAGDWDKRIARYSKKLKS